MTIQDIIDRNNKKKKLLEKPTVPQQKIDEGYIDYNKILSDQEKTRLTVINILN